VRSVQTTLLAACEIPWAALTPWRCIHVAKEDVICEIFKRVMNTGVSITGALIAVLLAIIGYLLVHPVGLQ
jgi:hypothetical protein